MILSRVGKNGITVKRRGEAGLYWLVGQVVGIPATLEVERNTGRLPWSAWPVTALATLERLAGNNSGYPGGRGRSSSGYPGAPSW